MIVVSDTTPLNYLILINAIDVLPALFQEVVVPSAVLNELGHANAPPAVAEWAGHPPAWLRVANPSFRLSSTEGLDDGEADAISVAKESGIAHLLIDEAAGRRVAAMEGLIAIPTLAVLELAAERDFLDLAVAIERLRHTSFRVRRLLLDAALARDAARKQQRSTEP
jgi:predicted nucleic acid-binding protein